MVVIGGLLKHDALIICAKLYLEAWAARARTGVLTRSFTSNIAYLRFSNITFSNMREWLKKRPPIFLLGFSTLHLGFKA